MAVAKTLEIISSSTESIEAAVRDGLAKAGETVHGIQEAWVQGTKAVVREGKVAESASHAEDYVHCYIGSTVGCNLCPKRMARSPR